MLFSPRFLSPCFIPSRHAMVWAGGKTFSCRTCLPGPLAPCLVPLDQGGKSFLILGLSKAFQQVCIGA